MAPVDKAANNVVVWRLRYINILKQELSGTKAYELQPLIEERSVVNDPTYHPATEFAVLNKAKISVIRCIGCLNFTKDHTKHDLLQP